MTSFVGSRLGILQRTLNARKGRSARARATRTCWLHGRHESGITRQLACRSRQRERVSFRHTLKCALRFELSLKDLAHFLPGDLMGRMVGVSDTRVMCICSSKVLQIWRALERNRLATVPTGGGLLVIAVGGQITLCGTGKRIMGGMTQR